MIPEIDIWRAATLMIKRYGDKALEESAARADQLEAEGAILTAPPPGAGSHEQSSSWQMPRHPDRCTDSTCPRLEEDATGLTAVKALRNTICANPATLG